MKKIKRLTALIVVCLLVICTSSGNMFASAMQENTEEALQQGALVNYLVIEEPMVTSPGTQTVMVGIGDENIRIQAASLTYRNQETGQIYETEALEILEDFVLFQMEYPDQSFKGSYRLVSITYTAEGMKTETAFSDMGIDAAYGVDQIVESEPDDVLLTDEETEALAEETEVNMISLDEEGNPVSAETLEEALEQAGCQSDAGADMEANIETDIETGMEILRGKAAASETVDTTGMSSLIVVLDAGHGGSDPGVQKNNIVEKTVNLKIAQYCKAELEEYSGIKVFMTRTNDTYLSLAKRAQVAINKKADVFISLHNNSNTSPGPSGANVYYPNSNYNSGCGSTGRALAQIIESKLTDLGLASGGIHIRNTENGTKYPDGSAADYYGVIKRCKENGIPALIVEHAFISNAADAKNYLSTDEQLKKLGIADATGIAEYYGLKKGLGFNSIESVSSTSMDLSWSKVNGVTGYCIYRSNSSGGSFTEVAKVTPATQTSWTDTGLTPGKTYYYKIRTYTKSGSKIKYGKYSSTASGTTIMRPVISSIKSKNSKALVISWDTVNNAANYEIYRADKKNGVFSRIATLAGVNRLTYTDTKVKAGKKYFYKIRSVGQIDKTTVYSDYSDVVIARTAKVPTGVSVRSEASNTLRVSWKAEKNAAGYQIKRADSAKGKYKKIAEVQGGSAAYYDDASVKSNRTYYYKVQSFNYNGDTKGVSGYGTSASAKTIPGTSMKKIETAFTEQTIKWKKAKGVDGYIVYQSTSLEGPYKKLKKISGAKKTSYKVTNLTPGTRYYYKVRTRKKVNGKVGYGSYTEACGVWTKAAPVITSVKGLTGASVEVTWNPVGGAAGYDIYRSDTAAGTYQKIASVLASNTRYTDKNLMMTKQYYYKIDAHINGYHTAGTTGMGAAFSGTPVSVTHITSVAVNSQGKLAVTWEPVRDIKGYRIYRYTNLNGTYDFTKEISASETVYVDEEADDNTTYYYKIVLINQYNGQEGPYSSAVSGKKEVVSPQAPEAIE